MARRDRENIDDILRSWPYEPEAVSVRVRQGDDGRDVLQMRVDLGLLQLEVAGRPDGTRPNGAESYYDYLLKAQLRHGDSFRLEPRHFGEVDREFLQFYHRRICWLALRNYRRAMRDADHTLGLMDFCRQHAEDDQWVMTHEQYRPLVLFHRTQAAALAESESRGFRHGVREIDRGLDRLREFFVEHDAEPQFDDDDLVLRLSELRDSLREQYDAGYRLRQQLQDAVAAEKYELAAKLRDKLAQIERRGR